MTTWPQQGCSYLHRLGFALKVPRPRHPRAADQAEAREWKKNLAQRLASIHLAHPGAEVELWAEDEARLGLKPVLRRVWAPQGKNQRPIAAVRQRYQWMYVYGFVHPSTGRSEWWLLPGVSTEAMNAVLHEFATLSGAGPQKQIVLLVDGAGWHTSKALQIPEGVHLHYLPA